MKSKLWVLLPVLVFLMACMSSPPEDVVPETNALDPEDFIKSEELDVFRTEMDGLRAELNALAGAEIDRLYGEIEAIHLNNDALQQQLTSGYAPVEQLNERVYLIESAPPPLGPAELAESIHRELEAPITAIVHDQVNDQIHNVREEFYTRMDTAENTVISIGDSIEELKRDLAALESQNSQFSHSDLIAGIDRLINSYLSLIHI